MNFITPNFSITLSFFHQIRDVTNAKTEYVCIRTWEELTNAWNQYVSDRRMNNDLLAK